MLKCRCPEMPFPVFLCCGCNLHIQVGQGGLGKNGGGVRRVSCAPGIFWRWLPNFMSSKRKNRPASDNKLKLFPEEKRCREDRTESETDEDPCEAATMAAEDEAIKLDTILNKLKKLDSIEGRLEDVFQAISSIESKISSLDKDFKDLKDKVKRNSRTIEDLEESVEFNEEDISDLKRDVKEALYTADALKKQLLYQEHYSRRENLMFIGIAEHTANPQAGNVSETQKENTKEVIFKFMEEELKIQDARKRFEFQRIHCLGKKKGNAPRPIIARFLGYTDREEVLAQARVTLTKLSVYSRASQKNCIT